MPKKVYIDFESRSQADIWTTGAYRYAEDPSTEVLCLAWAIDDGPVQGALYGKLSEATPIINQLIQSGAEFHAHNAFFERSIWKFHAEKFGLLPIPLRQWRCTAAKVSAAALPRRLEHAALALGCSHQKDMEGSRVMRSLCTTTGPIPQEKLERLLLYCKRDVETERDIDKRLPDLSSAEQRVWFMDQYINDRGVEIDIKAVENAITLIAAETKERNEELFTLTGGQVNAGTKREAIKNYLERQGVVLPDLTKATVKEALKTTDGDNFRVLQLRQQLSLTSLAKFSALFTAVSSDGRVRDTLIYHGAATGRWSGKLVQIQNLVKSTYKPDAVAAAIATLKTSPEGFAVCYDVLPTLSSCIRGMFVPTIGQEMFITDFAAIEARVVMWLAGEEKGVKQFADKDRDPSLPDIYVQMAKTISPTATRQLGKQAILGCGYGMGRVKFQETCEKYGIEVTPALAERAVNAYRTSFPAVPRFWYALEDAAKKTVCSGKPHTCGKISWRMAGDFLQMVLPSGRVIVYHHPKITAEGKLTFLGVNSVTNKYEVEETWGGKLVENATQAVARDLMVEAMFGLFAAEYQILFTIHDEIVVEKTIGEGSEKEVIDVVCKIPKWATGCPINAECKKTMRYQK